MVGELKKGKYTYYHCTGYKGSCNEPYTREEVLNQEFYYFLDARSTILTRTPWWPLPITVSPSQSPKG
jgi:hypothetical protein